MDYDIKKYLLAAIAALALTVALAGAPVRASEVTNDDGDYIGETDGCDGGECDVTNDDGDHIGTASGCMRGDECDVTNDDGDHIGTAAPNDDE